MNAANFVNETRNAIWLSGYVRGGDENHLLLYQSSNEDRAIPIQVSNRQRRPRPNTPCEIKCRAYGYRDEAGQHWVRLEAIQIKRASVTSTPRRLVALNALRPRDALSSADYNPFVSLEKLKQEVRDSLRLDDSIVDSLLADASKRTSLRDGFQNRVILSGFVGYKAFYPPVDDGSGDLGHIRVNIHQFPDPERALQIRVLGADGRFSKELKTLHPITVIAQVRTEVEKDTEGKVISRRAYLATERNQVGYATVNDFANKAFPAWWQNVVAEYYEKRKKAAGQTSAPQTISPVMPAGVQTVDETF